MYRCRQDRLGIGLWASSVEAVTCKGEKGIKARNVSEEETYVDV
jgi:hypothetical protein